MASRPAWLAMFIAAGILIASAPAVKAQTSPAEAPPASTAAMQSLTEVTVTGSRIITNGNDAPTPVTVITPDQVLATQPTTLYQNLTDMPVFSGSRGASNGPVTTSPNAAGGNQPNGAVSSLNLRNMGPLRTLVLFDGHRVPPVSPDGLVDPSSLPQMLIRRVDVVTGGASAVYGSDAITGVVNFITDSKFDGVKTELQKGWAQHGGAGSNEAGIAAGTKLFGGRGHIEASFQRLHDDPLYDFQRSWTKYRWTVQGNGTTVPWQLRPYVTNATASFGGSIACASGANAGSVNPANCPGQPNVGLTFNQNGVWSPFDPGTRTGLTQTVVQNGGDGAYFDNVALQSAQTTDQFFGRFDYDLTDNVHAYVAGTWNSNHVEGNIGTQRTFVPGVNVGACNAFLSAGYQAQLGCTAANDGTAGEPTFKFEKQIDPLNNYGIGQNNRLENHNYYVLAAVNGRFGDGYRWEASYGHSQAELTVSGLNQNRQHIYASLDAAVDPATGNIVCRITLTNPTVLPGCVPIDPFGPTAASRAAVAYWFDTITNTTDNRMDDASVSLTGAPLRGWAGPIDMALSAEFRRLTMDLNSDSLPTDFLDCTGLRFKNCNPALPVHPNTFAPVSGPNQKISEAAYELNVPLVGDGPVLLRQLSFDGAARYARYRNDPNSTAVVSRTFSATTWKAGLIWDLSDTLTLRWTRSRDFRAPSLYDLYQPIATGNTTNGIDYLLGGAASSPRLKTGGNPYLDPEVGLTSTLGVVYRPTHDLSLSVDAYRISISNALYQLSGLSQVVQQACYASGGSSPLCQLQERADGSFTDTSPSNVMTAYYQRSVNIARQETSGIDMEANFHSRVRSRPLSLRGLVTWQPHILYYVPFAARQDVAGVAYPQLGGFPAPVWKASLFLDYQASQRWTVDLSERYRSRLHFSSDPTAANEIGGVASVAYTNVTLSYDVPSVLDRLEVFVNVQNLFDRDPPPAGSLNNNFPGSFPSDYAVGDDVVGRYFVLGVRARL